METYPVPLPPASSATVLLMALCQRCPAPLPQPTGISIQSIHHVGESWASPSYIGNSLAEKSWLCTQLLSSSLKMTGEEINNGICHVHILCSLQSMGHTLNIVKSSSTQNQEVNLNSKGWEWPGLKEGSPVLTATQPPPSILTSDSEVVKLKI